MQAYGGIDSVRLLQHAMRVTEQNQRMIANNIANVDTPHFKPRNLDFQATLQAELEGRGRVDLRKTQVRHFDVARQHPQFESIAFMSKNDYNEVDLDEQMTKLSENTGRYTLFSSLMTKQFRLYRNMLETLR